MDYGETLNLPKTDFPMRGNLPKREPDFLEFWEKIDIYGKVKENRAGKEKFILHDGPPYANGDIHLGHTLNKVLKDMIIKYKTMAGYDAPYVPGWDTHGLPIEQQAIKKLGLDRKKVDVVEFRDQCAEYAKKYVDIQKEEFKRLGVRGDWDHPYLTLQPEYEAAQIGVFGTMAEKGYIYKGLKPVYWCSNCETALAEAEIEYADKKSTSIYVKFQVKDGKGFLTDNDYIVIWTTTPWTIPANVAISIHPDFEYVLADVNGEKLLLAKELLAAFLEKIGQENHKILKTFSGKELENIICQHPLLERESRVVLGEHVTLEAGTGCVHTAPGHGIDDFEVGKKYDLPVISPVDDRGIFTEEAGQYAGLNLKDGSKQVIEDLKECGCLIKAEEISHQYPYCWRCKTPIIFRATEQWFASIDGFREKALAEIDSVKWVPSWGRERIYNMIRDRGDWCISRQRTWGVPIPIFYCQDCGKEIINEETIAHIQELFRVHGSQIWFAKEAQDLVPEGLTCSCGSTDFRKETDIMDVWFDSGSSHAAVLEQREELKWPADLYLEGSDQHRGWFNSSLSTSVATKGKAPYKAVLTHGFVVDEKGRKMSKSVGNVVDPLKVIDQMGADVMRLWVASADYRSDLANSPSIMKQVAEAYRKIRNTSRFLLSNLYDFDAASERVAYDDLQEIDRWALHKLTELTKKVINAYENYEFYVAYHALHHFCVVDMSAFYLDICKDRLYVNHKDDPSRKAVQTVIYDVLHSLVRLIAPILTFTSEELWQHLPAVSSKQESIQLEDMPVADESLLDENLAKKWDEMLEIRDQVSKALETARKEKVIGHSLNATVILKHDNKTGMFLKSFDNLAGIFIVSQVVLAENGTETESLQVEVKAADGKKCERCWVYSTTVGQDENHPEVCARCAAVLKKK